ncbi:MAG: tetratricopeptide repeat protein, partial [Spirochaetia bacterium]|nr:tetratricopeptide repeat protein [Spirochaetia bacterium]
KSYYSQGDPYAVDLKYLKFLDSSFRGKESLERLLRSLPRAGRRYLSLSAEDPRKPGESGQGVYSFQNFEDPIDSQLELLRKQLGETVKASHWTEALAIADKILVLKPGDAKVNKSRQEILLHVEKEKESAWVKDLTQNSLESGNLLFNQKKYAEALEEYEKVLLLEKENPTARKQKLVIEYLIREENKNRSLGKFQELLEKGILYFNTDQYTLAVGMLESALELIPGNSVALEYLQLARGSLRNREESEIRLDSPYYPLIYNYQRDGLKAFREKRYEDSQSEWKKILFFFPKNREATRYSLACTLYLNPGLFKKVIDEKLQEGFRLLKAKQNKMALPIFELIQDLAPDTPGLAAYLKEAQGFKIKPPPSLLQAKYEEALAFYNQQDFERAKKIWKEILDLDDSEVQARLFIARVDNILGYDRQKSTDSSKSEREETIRRLQNQGLLYYNQGKYQDAIAEWEKILKISPDDKRAQNNIRRAKQFLNFK